MMSYVGERAFVAIQELVEDTEGTGRLVRGGHHDPSARSAAIG